MNSSRQLAVSGLSMVLTSMAVVAAMGGCSSDGSGSPNGAAGSSGSTGAAGTTGHAGTGSGGTTGNAGATGNAGTTSAGGTVANAGATGNAGTTASGGGGTSGTSAGGGGGGGVAPVFPDCTPVTLTDTSMPLITDFTMEGSSFGNYTDNFSGSIFTYSNIVGDTSMGAWHVTGTVSGVSAMVFGLSCKYDVSAFTGIRFDIKGSFAASDGGGDGGASEGGTADTPASYGGVATPQVTFTVGTAPDDVDSADSSSSPTWGTCVPRSGNQYDGTCSAPSKVIPLTALGGTQTLKWADLTGGKPRATPDPSQITSVSWGLPWKGDGPSYTVDITIDNVMFTTN